MANKTINNTNLPDYAVRQLEKIAVDNGFADGFTIEQDAGSKHGDGFMATMVSATITGIAAATKSVRYEMNLILKMLPESKARRDMFNSEDVFMREVTLYADVLPKFVEFQAAKGITSTSNGFYQFPKCHYAHSDAALNQHIIIMDDLRPQGFVLWDKLQPIPVENVRLLMQSLGRFHGLSFAIRDQRPEWFAEFRSLKSLMESMISTPFMENMFTTVFDQASQQFEAESSEREFMQRIIEKWNDNLRDCVSQDAANGRFSVLFHGDCWNNNMMFANAATTGVADRICMLDWQISQVVSPALDLSYFFMSSTTKALRDEHLPELLALYHRELTAIITACGSNANELFSFEDLQSELRRYGKYGVTMAPMLLSVIVNEPDNIVEMDKFADDTDEKKTFAKFDDKSQRRFAVRVADVINDAKAYGWVE